MSRRMERVKNNKKLASEKSALHAKVEPWIIDFGCSYHKTGNKEKFINIDKYDGR